MVKETTEGERGTRYKGGRFRKRKNRRGKEEEGYREVKAYSKRERFKKG